MCEKVRKYPKNINLIYCMEERNKLIVVKMSFNIV